MPSTRNQKNVSNRFDIATEHDTRLINNFSRVHARLARYFPCWEMKGRKEREEQGKRRGREGEKKKRKERNEKKGMFETKSKVQGNNLGMYRTTYVRVTRSIPNQTLRLRPSQTRLPWKKKGNGEYSVSGDTPFPNGKRLKETGYGHSFRNKGWEGTREGTGKGANERYYFTVVEKE